MYKPLLIGTSMMALALATAGPTAAQQGEPQGGPPVIEAPRPPVLGSAVADGGGRGVEHTAFTAGSGPGNDVGLSRSRMEAINAMAAEIGENSLSYEGLDTADFAARISNFTATGQISSSQNAGNASTVAAGTGVNFIVNQGADNPAIVTEGAVLREIVVDTTETVDPDGNEITEESGTYTETAAPEIQTTYNDGHASASGGGASFLVGDEVQQQTHRAWTVGSGTGNDVGLDRSQIVTQNGLNATISGNEMTLTGAEGDAAVSVRSAAVIDTANVTGQASFAQNAGNHSAVSAGTAVTFISNFTTAPGILQ